MRVDASPAFRMHTLKLEKLPAELSGAGDNRRRSRRAADRTILATLRSERDGRGEPLAHEVEVTHRLRLRVNQLQLIDGRQLR